MKLIHFERRKQSRGIIKRMIKRHPDREIIDNYVTIMPVDWLLFLLSSIIDPNSNSRRYFSFCITSFVCVDNACMLIN